MVVCTYSDDDDDDERDERSFVPLVNWVEDQPVAPPLHHPNDPNLESSRISSVKFAPAPEQTFINLDVASELLFTITVVQIINKLPREIPQEIGPIDQSLFVIHSSFYRAVLKRGTQNPLPNKNKELSHVEV